MTMNTSLSPPHTANISTIMIIEGQHGQHPEHDDRHAECDRHERADQHREQDDAEPLAGRPSLRRRLRVRHVRRAERAEPALSLVELGVHAGELPDHGVVAARAAGQTTNRNASPPAPFTLDAGEMLSLCSARTSPSG